MKLVKSNKTVWNSSLKNAGIQLEKKLNTFIQHQLNQEEISRKLSEKSLHQADKLIELQQFMETMSAIFNFPSKNDVANTSKLVIQTEEKIDSIADQLLGINQTLEDVKRLLIKEELETASSNKKKKKERR